jgi:shikimate 5-dehydrogenase
MELRGVEAGNNTYLVGSGGNARGIIYIELKNNFTSEFDTTLLSKTSRY